MAKEKQRFAVTIAGCQGALKGLRERYARQGSALTPEQEASSQAVIRAYDLVGNLDRQFSAFSKDWVTAERESATASVDLAALRGVVRTVRHIEEALVRREPAIGPLISEINAELIKVTQLPSGERICAAGTALAE